MYFDNKGMIILQNKVEQIVQWLKQQVKEANVNGLVVGVSGGLDSAVVANLMKRACPNDSMAVIMPLKSNEEDLQDARKVVEACDINHVTIDLTETHRTLYHTVQAAIAEQEAWNDATDRINDANLRARLRMNTLYTIAANYRYLVVGTDNAAEWYTGYFTKYGDGGVDLLPIVDLTKQEVYDMATYLNVPQSVIDKRPSADLWDGQTDEEEMGTTYDKIDAYIEGKQIPEADKNKIEAMHRSTAHKRAIPKQFFLK